MKRLIALLLVLSFCGIAFAGGQKDEGTKVVTLLGGFTGKSYVPIIEKFKAEYPDIFMQVAPTDVSTGAAISLDAYLAAGIPPNAYLDFISRSGKMMRPDMAIDLKEYAPAALWDTFNQEVLAQVTRDGKVVGIPFAGQLDGMFINTTLLREVGYVRPENWTIADYLEMCQLVKDRAPGKFGSMIFAANQSSTEWMLGFFAAFGCEFFKDGDYSKTVIRETGGEKVFVFFKHLLDKGFVPAESATLTDDDSRAMMLRGDIATCGDYVADWTASIVSQAEQGIIDKPFDFEMDSFPRADANAPLTKIIFVYAAIVPIASGDKYVDEAIANLALGFADPEWQAAHAAENKNYPTVKVDIPPPNKAWATGKRLMENNGLFDIGISSQTYFKIRPLLHKEVQAVLTGSKTPAQAIADYAKGINEALQW